MTETNRKDEEERQFDPGQTNQTETAENADASTEESAASPQPSLEEQLAAAIAERDANLDHWKRSQAELENFRRRTQREIEQNRQYQALPLIRDLLPALDNLQRAIKAAETTQSIKDLVQGVEMVAMQINDVFSRYSATRIEAQGKPFDPNLHEAIQQLPSEYPAMTVIDEIEPGYVLHDRVVRPSKVIVSSGPPPEAATTEEVSP